MPPPTTNIVPPKPTQLPAQPMPNPNSKPQEQQEVYSVDPNQ